MKTHKWFRAPHIREALQTITRPVVATLATIALIASFASYACLRPTIAKAAMTSPAPTAAALDDNSIGALLSLDKAMETLAARVTPAIVNVAVTAKTHPDVGDQEQSDDSQQFFGQFFGHGMQPPQPQIQHGIGSGVLVSPDGYIVTNNHVVDGAVDIRVTMSNRKILKAKLIGTDKLTDLAVIKIDGSNFPSVPWGNSTELHPGQTVLAFGNPFGFRFTVTRGIVSALNRPNPFSTDPRRPGGFIQTDAAINQGNSGGPLVNSHGEVIGINTFLISPSGAFSGMGFAIPSQLVRPTVDNLIRYGKVSHGYMGIGISDVTPENAKFFQLDESTGAVVTQVEANSPGAKAGLKVGDVITDLDGQQITDAGNLQLEVGQKRPGTTINLQVMREGKHIKLPITLEEMGSRDAEANRNANAEPGKMRWGLGLADMTPETRQQVQAPDNVNGAVVERVQPGSSADNAGLQPGDVIQEVNRHPVQNSADVQKALASIGNGQDAMVLVWSNGGNAFRVLHASEGS